MSKRKVTKRKQETEQEKLQRQADEGAFDVLPGGGGTATPRKPPAPKPEQIDVYGLPQLGLLRRSIAIFARDDVQEPDRLKVRDTWDDWVVETRSKHSFWLMAGYVRIIPMSNNRFELRRVFETLDGTPEAEALRRVSNNLHQRLRELGLKSLVEHSEQELTTETAPGAPTDMPELPPDPLNERRLRVRELKLARWKRDEIAKDIKESIEIVKKDLEWLRGKGLLPKKQRPGQ